MVIQEALSMEDKLRILSDAAKYDVSCTSSGVNRGGKAGSLGNAEALGICHSFAADGRCISLLKILYTNECIHDCRYCINRRSNDVIRTSFTPEEVCRLTMEFYRRNYIEGLFLSSGVRISPNYTMEEICQTIIMLRETYHFRGYIHIKAIPGAHPDLIEMAGWYADRVSVNLELPTADGLHELAPGKTRENILLPIRQLQMGIAESRNQYGMRGGNRSAYWHTEQKLKKEWGTERFEAAQKKPISGQKPAAHQEIYNPEQKLELGKTSACVRSEEHVGQEEIPDTQKRKLCTERKLIVEEDSGNRFKAGASHLEPKQAGGLHFYPDYARKERKGFAVAGQSTQMIVGATGETDWQMIQVAEAMYQRFDIKRMFYSAFVRVNDDPRLPVLPGGPPLLREHRLYQADWLFRYYGFTAKELLSEKNPNFNVFLDPKCDWALQHMENFPVEAATADYFQLLRVPGIGPKSARRIVSARKEGKLTVASLRKMGVVWKRAQYFLCCNGKMEYGMKKSQDEIANCLIGDDSRTMKGRLEAYGAGYQQLSLFDMRQFSAAGQ